MSPIRIGLVGLGKIARDQHLPAIAASPDFELAAVADPQGGLDGYPSYPSAEAMIAGVPSLNAVVLCQPPQARYAAASAAIAAGKHVFLEKPPGATLAEVAALRQQAEAAGVSLFAAWHSRYAAAVAPARAWLAGRRVDAARITWREDVRAWHPGQAWIWRAGGMGVFDPGINALSIATALLPPFRLVEGRLEVPANRQAPIAADLTFALPDGAALTCDIDWRQEGPQTWDIRVETDGGTLVLSQGGAALAIDGEPRPQPANAEYPALYARFATLVGERASDMDLQPLVHVADAFLRAERVEVDAFVE